MNRCLPMVLLLLCSCASTPVDGLRGTEELRDKTPLQRAEEMISASNYAGARKALAEHLEDEPESTQARYLLAKTLAYLGELRGARTEAQRTLSENPSNPLAWDLLGSLHEQLGDHEEALSAYLEVQSRTDSLAPILAIARCQLYLGRPEAALGSLEAARARKKRDPWTEFFTYQALKRMGQQEAAETAARDYLEMATGEPDHATYVGRVRSWLNEKRSRLEPGTCRAMVDFVRAAIGLRLPGAEPPENSVLKRAPDRLFIFDDRPVFVTLFPAGSSERFRGIGRGRSLAAALKGAVSDLQQRKGFTPLKLRKSAVRIDVGRDLEPIQLRRDREGLVATPAVERGRHGIALRADGAEVFCLVGDPISDDLPDLEAMLNHACRGGDLAPQAWQTATGSLFRFEAESFLSLAPGVAPVGLDASEPGPLPQATLSTLRAATARGARWLTTLLQPKAGIAAGYSPPRNTLDGGGDVAVTKADERTAARVALALAKINADGSDAVMLAARDHLVAGGVSADSVARAWSLAALSLGKSRDSHDALRKRLAGHLLDPPDSARIPAGIALSYFGARDRNQKWRRAVTRLSRGVSPDSVAEVELLLRSALRDTKVARSVLKWAKQQLSAPPEADGPKRARWLAALAGAAKVAREQGHADTQRLRAAVLEHVRELLALQIGRRHQYLCADPTRALGGFRRSLGNSHLDPAMTAECLLALVACDELLSR